MDTKTCPSCGTEVPAVATRCRHCFHDFAEDAKRASTGGPLLLLAAVAGMALLGAGTFWWLSQSPTDTRILVDGTTRTVQWVEQFQDGRLETDRVSFDDIRRIELHVAHNGDNEIIVHTASGEAKVVESHRSTNLTLKAEEYARMMGLTLEVRNDTKSPFGGN